mgnify:CR=1 FL=1
MVPEKNRCDSVRNVNPDWDWDYWEAQLSGYQIVFKKPIWRDYLQTQKKKMDAVHEFFWSEKKGQKP